MFSNLLIHSHKDYLMIILMINTGVIPFVTYLINKSPNTTEMIFFYDY